MIKIDNNKEDPFEGLCLIMNIDENTNCSNEYKKILSDTLSECLAKGFAIVFSYDKVIEKIPEWLENNEDYTFFRLSSFFGMKTFDFSFMPDERKTEISNIINMLFKNKKEEFSIINKKAVIMGRCRISGKEVFLPPIKIEI